MSTGAFSTQLTAATLCSTGQVGGPEEECKVSGCVSLVRLYAEVCSRSWPLCAHRWQVWVWSKAGTQGLTYRRGLHCYLGDHRADLCQVSPRISPLSPQMGTRRLQGKVKISSVNFICVIPDILKHAWLTCDTQVSTSVPKCMLGAGLSPSPTVQT